MEWSLIVPIAEYIILNSAICFFVFPKQASNACGITLYPLTVPIVRDRTERWLLTGRYFLNYRQRMFISVYTEPNWRSWKHWSCYKYLQWKEIIVKSCLCTIFRWTNLYRELFLEVDKHHWNNGTFPRISSRARPWVDVTQQIFYNWHYAEHFVCPRWVRHRFLLWFFRSALRCRTQFGRCCEPCACYACFSLSQSTS